MEGSDLHFFIALDKPLMDALAHDDIFFIRDSNGETWNIFSSGAGDLILKKGEATMFVPLEDWFTQNKADICSDQCIESFWEWFDDKHPEYFSSSNW